MTATIAEPVRSNRGSAPEEFGSVTTTQRPARRGPFAVLRSILFWSHLTMGTIGGVIIFIMSVTGALLGFEKQLIARYDGVAQAVPPSATATKLSLDSLLLRANVDVADVASLGLKAGRTEPVTVRFRARDRAAVLLDPYAGTVIPPVPRGKMQAAMTWLRGWHRWLGVDGDKRPLMRKFTGISNIAFLLLVFTGLYIWWPKRLSRAAFKTAAVFNPALHGKPRDFNWHNSLGFWSAVPLAVVVASGVFISYQWPGQWMDRLWGSDQERAAAIKAMNTPPVAEGAREGAAPAAAAAAAQSGGGGGRGGNAGGGENRNNSAAPARVLAPIGQMFATAESARPKWTAITITPAAPRDSVVQVAISEGNTYRPDLKMQYFFNAETGVQTRLTNFDSLSTSRKIRGWTRFGHTGEIFGMTGQVVATFVSFVGAILVYTGLALAFRRLLAFVRRRRRGAVLA